MEVVAPREEEEEGEEEEGEEEEEEVLHILVFFYIKFTKERRRENVTFYVASQDAELDFGFGTQHVPSLTGLLHTE
jgi:hypothetical protein